MYGKLISEKVRPFNEEDRVESKNKKAGCFSHP